MVRIWRRLVVYQAWAAMVPKLFLAYSMWVWMHFIVELIAMIIFVAFWTAIYAEESTIAGLDQRQTVNYILLARLMGPVVYSSGVIFFFGRLMREGQMAIELLRPVDFQAATYVSTISETLVALILQTPLALIAWVVFGLRLTADPITWAAFILSLVLGHAILFCFDWILGCVSFYSTETWGMSVVRFGVGTFLSGILVPLDMMPGWLQTLAGLLPFAQALYTPVSLLSGITPLSAMPRIWGLQIIYLLILGPLSRIVFNLAVRKVTVQGG